MTRWLVLPGTEADSGRDLPLDGLRGVASLSVVIFHFVAVFFPAAINGDVASAHSGFEIRFWNSPFFFVANGTFDVAIFFVLSGYVLTTDTFRTGRTDQATRRALGRWLRLAIPAGASTLAVFVLLHLDLYRFREASAFSGADKIIDSHALLAFPRDVWSLLDNLLWSPWFRSPDLIRLYNMVLWTMPIEFWGSMMVFGASALLLRVPGRSIILLVWSAVLFCAVSDNGPFLGAFVGGAALASVQSRRMPTMLGVTFCIVGLALGGYDDSPLFGPLRGVAGALLVSPAAPKTVYCIGAILLVVAAVHAAPFRRLLAHPKLTYLGRISFSLYLVHQPIIYSAGAATFLYCLGFSNYLVAAASALVSVLGLSFVVAHFAEKWVDRPAIRIARRFAKAMTPEARGTNQAVAREERAPHHAGRGRVPGLVRSI